MGDNNEVSRPDYENQPQSTQKETRVCEQCWKAFEREDYDPNACHVHRHRTQTSLVLFQQQCQARFPANENACEHYKIDPLHRLAILAGELAHRQLDHSREMMVTTAIDFTCVCAYFWRTEINLDGESSQYTIMDFWRLVVHEICRARFLFPSNRGVTSAFMEELGEAIEAMAAEKNPHEVRIELVQAAAMAARLALEGDPTMDKVRSDRELDS